MMMRSNSGINLQMNSLYEMILLFSVNDLLFSNLNTMLQQSVHMIGCSPCLLPISFSRSKRPVGTLQYLDLYFQ
jgi:hypothetical protein